MLVDFHPEATEELTESVDWYADRSSVAGRSFLVAVDVAIVSILNATKRFPHIDDLQQSCSVIGFPFQNIFRHDAERIRIVAVAHAKRRPGYWRDR